MNELTTDNPSFDLGTWLGRMQAFRLIASRSSVADIMTSDILRLLRALRH